jgi:hypothetical protein
VRPEGVVDSDDRVGCPVGYPPCGMAWSLHRAPGISKPCNSHSRRLAPRLSMTSTSQCDFTSRGSTTAGPYGAGTARRRVGAGWRVRRFVVAPGRGIGVQGPGPRLFGRVVAERHLRTLARPLHELTKTAGSLWSCPLDLPVEVEDGWRLGEVLVHREGQVGRGRGTGRQSRCRQLLDHDPVHVAGGHLGDE